MAAEKLYLIQDIETPFYLYDFDKISHRLNDLKTHLPDALLYFAVKANSNLELLKRMRPLIDGLDVSSAGELVQAITAGYQGNQFSFAGPGKTDAEITTALENQCGSMSIESLDDLKRISRIASELGTKAPVLLRINPQKVNKKFAMKMGGRPTQFGVDEEKALDVLEIIKNDNNLDFQGYHIYSGTQSLDADGLVEYFENNLEVVQAMVAGSGMIPRKVNMGGGLGITYHEGEEPLELEKVAQGFCAVAAEFKREFGAATIIELGRYIIGEFGWYITRVLSVKESRGREYVITDGGMHHNLAASGNLGQVVRKNYKVVNLSRPEQRSGEKNQNLAGCLCTPLDVLGVGLDLPGPQVGDLVAIEVSGAYGYTASPLLFLGHDTPAEYLYDKGKVMQIRRSFTLADFN